MGKNLRNMIKKDELDMSKIDNNKIDDVKNIYNQYAGKDESELKEKLINMTMEGKKDGSISNEKIDAMAQKIMPMLDEDKREKLNSIISMLKQ